MTTVKNIAQKRLTLLQLNESWVFGKFMRAIFTLPHDAPKSLPAVAQNTATQGNILFAPLTVQCIHE